MKDSIESIKKYINSKLSRKLREDALNLNILNERDLEHRIYHHLANEIDEKRFLIYTNKTIGGIKMKKKKSSWGIMPDLIIRDRKQNDDIVLVMELKATKIETKTAFLGYSAEKGINKDCKKFRKMLKNRKLGNQIKFGFFIYLYRDAETGNKEEKIRKILKNKLCDKRLHPVCINKYQKNNGEILSQSKISEFEKEFEDLYSIRVGGKKQKKRNKSKGSRKRSKGSRKRSTGSVNAWRKMNRDVKDPKWRKAHPNAPVTKNYNHKHGVR